MNQLDADHIVGHLASLMAIVGTLAGYLPEAAAGAALIWYLLQAWESRTITHWRARRKRRRGR